MALLKAAGVEQEAASRDQGELAETMWAEMGLHPDAHITQVCSYYIKASCLTLSAVISKHGVMPSQSVGNAGQAKQEG